MSETRAAETSPAVIARVVRDRQHLTRVETEDFLRAVSAAWAERRQEKLWRRDYANIEAYLRSVAPNRERWRAAIGDAAALELPQSEEPLTRRPFLLEGEIEAEWLTVPVAAGLFARAILAVPRRRKGPLPLVIAQHGISSSPERVMGFDDPEGLYHAYGRALVEAGFAVLAPQHITWIEPRGRLQRMCLMLGITLWGLEIYKLQRLLDAVLSEPGIDADRIAMWGISLGGAYTLFTLPLEPRIRVGICTAWFNDRYRKMLIDDPRYSCFLSTREEHVFIPRWLVEFDDADLVSLICPRPFQIQTGKADGIAWWPFVVEAFRRAKAHYERLG
ncbi:MAG TPA: hypothetical protein VF234_06035, partial [Limnochordia bacterium]